MAKKAKAPVETGAGEYLESFSKTHRLVMMDKGMIDLLKKAGVRLIARPVAAPQFGPAPVAYIVEVMRGKFIERC
jgi:hypothetical protein